jgi:hypothetical protein
MVGGNGFVGGGFGDFDGAFGGIGFVGGLLFGGGEVGAWGGE